MSEHTIRITSPGELAATLPWCLGFVPEDSLVIVCTVDGHISMTARLDLPGVDEVVDVLAQMLPVIQRDHPDLIHLLAYDDADGLCESLAGVAAYCAEAGLEVGYLLRVCRGRFSHVGPGGQEHGGALLPAPESVPAIIEHIARGVRLLPGRTHLVEALTPRGDPSLERVLRAQDWSRDRHAAMLRHACTVWGSLTRGRQPDDDDLAVAVAALEDRGFRDALIDRLAPSADDLSAHLPDSVRSELRVSGPPTPEDGNAVYAAIDALALVVARLPVDRSAPTLSVLACVAWHYGHGTIAAVATEHALAAAPDYQLARLLDQCMTHGIRPRPADSTRTGRESA